LRFLRFEISLALGVLYKLAQPQLDNLSFWFFGSYKTAPGAIPRAFPCLALPRYHLALMPLDEATREGPKCSGAKRA